MRTLLGSSWLLCVLVVLAIAGVLGLEVLLRQTNDKIEPGVYVTDSEGLIWQVLYPVPRSPGRWEIGKRSGSGGEGYLSIVADESELQVYHGSIPERFDGLVPDVAESDPEFHKYWPSGKPVWVQLASPLNR